MMLSTDTSEAFFYAGQLIGIYIVYRLYKIENWTFLNKLFMTYFLMDTILGSVEIFFFFKLLKESDLDDFDKQLGNCSRYLFIYFNNSNQKFQFHLIIIFCR